MQLKALITDVDGVLTDGRLFLSDNGQWRRMFHILDGVAFKALLKNNIKVGVISGSNAEDITARMQALGVEEVHIGIQDKEPVFDSILDKWDLSPKEVCYIGDDLPDQKILEKVGFAYTVPNAVKEIKSISGIKMSETPGGHGAFREIVDQLLKG